MSRGNELAKNTIILFVGIFFTKVLQYLLLPIYTSFLTTAEYGKYELCNTVVTLLLPFIGLQVDQGVFRFLINSRDNKVEIKKIVSSSLFFVCISILFYLLIFILLYRFIVDSYKWLIVINVAFCSLSSLFLQISRGIGNNKEYAISNFLISLLTIVFNLIFVIGIGLKVDGLLYGGAIGYFVGIVYLFFKIKLFHYLSFRSIDINVLKKIISYSLPMIPNSISWWIFSSSDRIIITSYIGLSATGILSIAYKFSNVLIIIYNIFNMSLTESISLHIEDKDIDDYFNEIFTKIGNIFVTLGVLVISFMPLIFNLLINKAYFEAYNMIPIAVIATIMQVYAGMLGTIYVANNNTKSIAMTSILSAIVNILIDLLLVSHVGIYAAVISTLVSFIVLYCYRINDVRKKYFDIKISKEFAVSIIFLIIIAVIFS